MPLNPEQILKSIVKDQDLVKEHRDWGFRIEVPFREIKMIGLIPKEGRLELSMYFGVTQDQSRAFYSREIRIDHFKKTKWNLFGDFHFSSTTSNLIWFPTKLSPEKYIDFWKANRQLLYQHNKKDLPELVKLLEKAGVITLDKKKTQELKEIIYEKDYNYLNVCAGFGVIYSIENTDVDELQRKGLLSQFLIQRINEGLSIIGRSGNDFLIKTSRIDNSDQDDSVEPDGF